MFKKFSQSTPLKNVLALASGALLVFAFAPFYQSYLAIMALALFLWTLIEASPKQAALRGLLFGFGLFGLGTSWIYVSIHTFGDTPIVIAAFITALFVFILSCLIAVNTYVWRRFFKFNDANTLLLAFPVLWVLFEWLRGTFFTGFPWLFLGYSQTHSLLSYLAALGGVYFISYLVALQASLIVFGLSHRRYRIYCLAGLLSIWLLAFAFHTIEWTHKQSTALKVALVQGNIPQSLKWDPAQAQKTLALYKHITQTLWDEQIIVWPEAAVPQLKNQVEDYLAELNLEAHQHTTALILGLPVHADNQYYNAMIGLGSAVGTYYKRHLVPFGEYIPLSFLRRLIGFFNLPMSDFSAGPSIQKGLNVLGFDLATYVCYEIAYPAEFLTQFPKAQLIVTLSNDAWFGHSFAASQQLQMSQMRSMETGRYQLVATDNGITAIINPHGEITGQLAQFQMAVLKGEVFAMQGATPYINLGTGGLLFILCVLFALAIAFRPEML